MATQISDDRKVRVSATNTELTSMVAAKAKELGLIDFVPAQTVIARGDGVEISNNEWVITFTAPPAS